MGDAVNFIMLWPLNVLNANVLIPRALVIPFVLIDRYAWMAVCPLSILSFHANSEYMSGFLRKPTSVPRHCRRNRSRVPL